MKQIISRTLWILAVVGLVFGGMSFRPDLPLPSDVSAAHSEVARVAAFATLSTHLPLIVHGFKVPTVFGAAMKFKVSGGMNEMTAADNYWLRHLVVSWSEVEQIKGTRDWSSLAGMDVELVNANLRGMETIVIVASTPGWAQKVTGYYCGPIHELELATFADFMYELVSRYSQWPHRVKYWEIWNEPDIDPALVAPDSGFGCWGDRNDAYYGGGYYAEMLKAVYPEIKRANPEAQVVVGGLVMDCDPRTPGLCNGADGDLPPRFLEGILQHNGANDGGNYFDGISFHAYDYYNAIGHYSNKNWSSAWDTTGPVVIAKARFIKEVLNNYGVSGKFLMNTESAIICGGAFDPPGGPGCESDPTSAFEQTKAYYLAQAYASAIAEDLRANIWYQVFGWRNSGLLNSDRSPRPAYQAFATSAKILRDAHLVREIDDYEQVKGYEYTRDPYILWVLWSLDGNVHMVTLDTLPAEMYDVLGNPVVISNPVRVGYTPLYLKWRP